MVFPCIQRVQLDEDPKSTNALSNKNVFVITVMLMIGNYARAAELS